jgi:hypothetical protein
MEAGAYPEKPAKRPRHTRCCPVLAPKAPSSIRASEFVMAAVTSAGIVRSRRTSADWLAGALVIIGAINWGLVGLLQLDLVAAIFGANSLPSKAV